MAHFMIRDITWADEDPSDLPSEVLIRLNDDADLANDPEVGQYVMEQLADQYQCLVVSFSYERQTIH